MRTKKTFTNKIIYFCYRGTAHYQNFTQNQPQSDYRAGTYFSFKYIPPTSDFYCVTLNFNINHLFHEYVTHLNTKSTFGLNNFFFDLVAHLSKFATSAANLWHYSLPSFTTSVNTIRFDACHV